VVVPQAKFPRLIPLVKQLLGAGGLQLVDPLRERLFGRFLTGELLVTELHAYGYHGRQDGDQQTNREKAASRQIPSRAALG